MLPNGTFLINLPMFTPIWENTKPNHNIKNNKE